MKCPPTRLHQWNILIQLDDASGTLNLEGWLYIVLCLYHFCRGGTILLAFWEKRHHFICNFGAADTFYGLFERGGTIKVIYIVQNYAGCSLKFPYVVHAQLEGCSFRSSNFIGVAIMICDIQYVVIVLAAVYTLPIDIDLSQHQPNLNSISHCACGIPTL